MSPERWQRLQFLFFAALDRNEGERSALLAAECGEDEQLLHEITSLLENATASNFGPLQEVPGPRSSILQEGDQLGPYRIVRVIDEGGMGEVYEAEEGPPIQRRVAIKVVRRGLRSAWAFAQFDGERKALGAMGHPHIAQVFQAGTLGEGRPFFIMEYVDGRPITKLCDDQRLSVRERVKLFLQVCQGVEHAHQKQVLHRDIKPGNVLISLVDGRPTAKIIDFGICLALDASRPLVAAATERVGTLEYMSPEQKVGDDLDTRTDIYSLGVLLSEILVGERPAQAAGTGLSQLASAMIKGGLRARSVEIANSRGTDPRKLVHELRGDLDSILAKALQPDRERRYASAAEMANDLERFLAYQPVMAGPSSRLYRAGKFVRRHRLSVAAAGVAAVALVVGAVGLALGLVQAQRAEAEALSQAEKARRTSSFLVDLFAASEPGQLQGENPTARELLERGAKRVALDLRDQPVVRSGLMTAIGRAYLSLGLYPEAEATLRQALRLHFQAPPDAQSQRAAILDPLAEVYRLQGKYPEARDLYDQALKLRAGERGVLPPEAAESLNGLGLILYNEGQLQDAEPYFKQAFELWRAAGDPRAGAALGHLALLARDQAHYPRAVDLFKEAHTLLEADFGPEHPNTQGNLNNLSEVYRVAGQYRKAEALLRRVLAVNERVLGPEHPDVIVTVNNLALVLTALEQYDEAEILYSRVLASDERLKGPVHPDYASTLNNLAIVYSRQGRISEAEANHRRALAIRLKAFGPDNPQVAASLYFIGWLRHDQRDFAEAERLLLRSLEIREKTLGPDHPHVAGSLGRLGALYRDQGRLTEAENSLRRAVAIWDKIPQPNPISLVSILETLVAVLRQTGRLEEASRYDARAETLRQHLAEERRGAAV